MFRFLLFFIFIIGVIPVSALTPKISHEEMARDLSSLIAARASIDELSGTGRTYVAFSRKYLNDLSAFSQKYVTPFRIFALRPQVDRSLLYHLHVQRYRVSCEIAALQIILTALRIGVTENDIISSIPQFPYPYAYASGGIWGDPDNEFVGFYTGSQSKQTGYGIYEKPLAKYIKIYGLKTEVLNQSTYSGTMNPGIHMSKLLQYLNKKNTHVILWGDWCTDPVYEDGVLSGGGKWIAGFFPLPGRNFCKNIAMNRLLNWKTPEGKDIIGLSGEHAFVLLGYVGTTEKPTHIIVWDTFTGRHVYVYSEWMRKWSQMQYRSLIISNR